MQSVTYEPYDDTSLIIKGDREKIKNYFSELEIKYKKDLNGYLVSKDEERKVKDISQVIARIDQLMIMEDSARSRKGQKKYHRAHSDDEQEIPPVIKEASESESDADEDAMIMKALGCEKSPSAPKKKPVYSPPKKKTTKYNRSPLRKDSTKKKPLKGLPDSIQRTYSQFGKDPKKKKHYQASSDELTSSSEADDSSEDDFPIPEDPVPRRRR